MLTCKISKSLICCYFKTLQTHEKEETTMSTAFTCTTPEDGWALYSHFLGNNLLTIRMYQESKDEEKDEESSAKRERVISDAWSKLVGNLYIIMRRMRANGHDEEAAKMKQIVDMTVELDLTDPATHDTIREKHKELNNRQSNFEAKLAKLRAMHAK